MVPLILHVVVARLVDSVGLKKAWLYVEAVAFLKVVV